MEADFFVDLPTFIRQNTFLYGTFASITATGHAANLFSINVIPMEWSLAKQELFRFETNVVVSAGAGSGKTAALVELYLRLLAGETCFPRPLSVDEIVAITFTDKAAVEMKERVRKEITNRRACGDRSAPWDSLLHSLSAAPISTFHAFCSRLLRENPAEAGVDPAFTLMDDLVAGGELQAALDEVIEGELKARTPEIRLLLEQYPLSGMGRGKGLREHLVDLRNKRAASGKGDDDLLLLAAQWDRQAASLFQEQLCALEALAGEVERILKGKELAFHRKLREFPQIYRQAPFLLEREETALRLTAMLECIGGNWGKERPLKEELENCVETLKLCCWQLRGAPCICALLALGAKVEQTYRRRKERRGGLDFDDLQARAQELLMHDERLREELHARYPVVMVDEFQDTNPQQKELLELLCGGEQRLFIVGDPKQSIYLFRGADVSVFGQAQAEITAAGGRNLYFRESFRSREGLIAFVNSFFSRVMAEGGAPFEVKYGEEDHLEPKRRDGEVSPCVELLDLGEEETGSGTRGLEAGAIARKILRLVSGEEGIRVYDAIKEEAAEPRAESSKLGPVFAPRKPGFGDIALLFRRFTHLKTYERELRKRGIPYYVVKGKGFYRCQEVLDLLNFLKYLDFGGDLTSLTGILRSPLCGVSDETLYLLSRFEGGIGKWESFSIQHSETKSANLERVDPGDRGKLQNLAMLINRLRPLRDRLTLAELMEEVVTGTDFASSLLTTFQGAQKVANLRKLIEFSRSFSADREGGLRSFVNYLVELVETEPTEAEAVISAEGEDVVRLMTVHQSKGLEFPIVFVPEMGAGHPVDHAPVQYDDTLGIGIKVALSGNVWQPTLAYRAITQLRAGKEKAELKRLLYVATTRARDHLVLSGEKGKGRAPWREWLDLYMAEEGASLVKMIRDDERLEGRNLTGVATLLPVCDPKEVEEGLRRAIGFIPPLPSTMVFSPTALEDYAACPRKYYYKAVMGLDEGLFAELLGRHGAKKKQAAAGLTPLQKGDLAHLLLERLDFAADTPTQRAACLRILRAALPGPETEGEEVLENVLSLAASPFGRGLQGKRIMREYPFSLQLTGDARYYIKGAMDLVVVTGESVTVYDYKYLRREDADLEGYRFQIRTYMLALSRGWPDKRIEGKLLFVKGGGEEGVECDFLQFEAQMRRMMDAIRTRRVEDQFSLLEGCDGATCPFRQRCLSGGSPSP